MNDDNQTIDAEMATKNISTASNLWSDFKLFYTSMCGLFTIHLKHESVDSYSLYLACGIERKMTTINDLMSAWALLKFFTFLTGRLLERGVY